MPFDPLSKWKSSFKTMVVPTMGVDGPIKMGMWLNSHISNKPMLDAATVSSPSFSCVWQPAIFIAQMLAIPPSLSPIPFALKLGQAWASATQASVLMVPAGAFVGAPTPPTLFSAPPVALFNPATIASGTALIIAKVSTAPPATESDKSAIIEALYQATTQLGVMLTGLNSIPPPAGPLPLIVPLCPLK